MAKDAVATMGAVLPDDAGGRDAVHVAVFSATCKHALIPGTDVGIVEHGEPDSIVGTDVKLIGIVDPYIDGVIKRGQRFWVYLYPRSITALSHKWSHPAFEAVDSSYVPPSQKLISEKWLRDYCAGHGMPPYETFIQAAAEYDGGDSLFVGSAESHSDITPELWEHVQNVLGRKLDGKPEYFSCSC